MEELELNIAVIKACIIFHHSLIISLTIIFTELINNFINLIFLKNLQLSCLTLSYLYIGNTNRFWALPSFYIRFESAMLRVSFKINLLTRFVPKCLFFLKIHANWMLKRRGSTLWGIKNMRFEGTFSIGL
jgi:hypothetical protein